MNIAGLLGKKINQSQGFLEDGKRVPITAIASSSNVISQVKKADNEGYWAAQIGFGKVTRPTKAVAGHVAKAGIKKENTPRFFHEIRVDEGFDGTPGQEINPEEVFKQGDLVDVTGTSKGKGYAGVVKRHGFRGGPRTHGQSDRERAPGSIGQTTTPGRVYKGKRMAGRMGNEQVTIKNLTVLDLKEGVLYLKGLVPGSLGTIVFIKKVGEDKKFTPLFSVKEEETLEVQVAPEIEEKVEEVVEEPKIEEVKEEKAEEKAEVKEEAKE